jgi:hypothetical protein
MFYEPAAVKLTETFFLRLAEANWLGSSFASSGAEFF